MYTMLVTSRPLEEIFLDLERWVINHPLGAVLLILIAWGLWFRRERY